MNTTRTFRRSIAGAATAAAIFAFAACGADAPPAQIDQPEETEFSPKYGEHSDEFQSDGSPSTLDNKPPGDSTP